MADEPEVVVEAAEDKLTYWDQHRFLLLIIATIAAAIVLTSISLAIYNLSGAAQLDLSRPGYQGVSDQVDTTSQIGDYSAIGPVNKEAVDEFLKLYDEQSAKAKAIDAFNGDPLNPEVLEFGVPAAE